MSSPDGSDGGSWIRRVMRNRTCRRACGFGVIITSFVVCMTGFVMAILAYKQIVASTWVPLGLSCGVPASVVCTLAFIYLLFFWKEDEVVPRVSDQDRVERSEPNEETPLLSYTEFPAEETISQESPKKGKLRASLPGDGISKSDSTATLGSSSEPKTQSTDTLTNSNEQNADSTSNTESAELADSTQESLLGKIKSEKGVDKPQAEVGERSGKSESLDESKSVSEECRVKPAYGTSESSVESFEVLDESKTEDHKRESKLQCAISGISMSCFKIPEKPEVSETVSHEISESSLISFEAKDSDISSIQSQDLKSDVHEDPKIPEVSSTSDVETASCEQKPVSTDDAK